MRKQAQRQKTSKHFFRVFSAVEDVYYLLFNNFFLVLILIGYYHIFLITDEYEYAVV